MNAPDSPQPSGGIDASDHVGITPDVDVRTAKIALAGLPSMSPPRLAKMLTYHDAVDLWHCLVTGRRLHPDLEQRGLDGLRAQASRSEPLTSHELASRGIGVVVRGERRYPHMLVDDIEAPEVLFYLGDLDRLKTRRVGIIGTRNATAAGRATAAQLGNELATVGVAVVSGLARGIDVSAHRGVRDAGAVGAVAIVGSGCDVVYPKQNRLMWEWVAHHGLLLSEWPPGSQPEAWHFPLRNRVIAALSEVLVVVESRERGGSLLTVENALDRGTDVMAVPGSTHCRAAAGTNQLIADGAGVVCSTDDVLRVLDITNCRRRPVDGEARQHRGCDPDEADADRSDARLVDGPARSPTAHPSGEQLCLPVLDDDHVKTLVYGLCQERPISMDELIASVGVSVGQIARAVAQLEHRGLIRELNGWVEGIGSRLMNPSDVPINP